MVKRHNISFLFFVTIFIRNEDIITLSHGEQSNNYIELNYNEK